MRAAVATVCEKITVVGGFDNQLVARTIEPSCEIFDLVTNQWSLVSSLDFFRADCSLFTSY